MQRNGSFYRKLLYGTGQHHNLRTVLADGLARKLASRRTSHKVSFTDGVSQHRFRYDDSLLRNGQS